MELHQSADEKSCSRADLLAPLRFETIGIKLIELPHLTWIKLLGDWPSIVNGGCRFALQARVKFIDQVRILVKNRILWNHGRVLEKFFMLLLGLILNFPWELYGPTLVLILEVLSAMEQCSLVCCISLLEQLKQ